MQTTTRQYASTSGASAVRGERREEIREGIHERRKTRKVLSGTYGLEALAGAAVVTLTIIALAAVLPRWLTSIAVIVAGGAFLIEGLGLGARARHIRESLQAEGVQTAALAGGASTQLIAGAAGVTLGILALLGIAPAVLLAIAAIVFGAALLLGSSATHEVSRFEGEYPYEASVARETLQASNGARALVGAGTITLGILSLIGVGPVLTLIVVAVLAVGAMLFLSGVAIGGSEAAAVRHA